ncbi:MAG TPA: ABC transporter permease [Blastocatellia bacterium]|nr:ABC transporter permease [Blastocatellia bacterium]
MAAMRRRRRKTFQRPWLWLLRLIGVIVPRRLRADWRQEWDAELRYRETLLTRWERLDWRAKFALLWHSLGAFTDALWLQPRRWEDEMFQDLRFGVRMLLKSKGFTAVAALSLAIGIGANTAIFSLLDALLLKTLPVRQPEQLVFVEDLGFAHPDPVFKEMSENNSVFDGMFSFHSIEMTVSDGNQAELVLGELVSGSYFNVLGVGPHLGRVFSGADDQTPGGDFVTVISYNYWRRRFGADPQVIGRKISVNNYPFTIIGVAAQGFNDVEIGLAPDLRVPMTMKREMLDHIDAAPVMARLKPGVGIAQAQAATDILYQNIIRQNNLRTSGESSPTERIFAPRIQLHSASTGAPLGLAGFTNLRTQFSQPLILLMCMVGVVLFIACLNVANLLLARAATRQKEIAVRLAVGAGRFRLVRQLLTEGFLLSALGGALGLVFARWGTDALLRFLPQDATLEIKPDLRMLGFTFGVSVLTGLFFGLAPALQATRFDLIPALKNDAAGVVGGRRRWGLRQLLVTLQVAMSLVLLISGTLFARSLRNLKAVDLGYTTDQIVTMETWPEGSGYSRDQQRNFYAQLIERVRALPGVKSAAYGLLPIRGYGEAPEIEVSGSQIPPNERPTTRFHPITSQYFVTFGMPMLRGRDINAQDSGLDYFEAQNSIGDYNRVVIVNDSFARYFFGDENPLGKRFSVGPIKNLEIVGVVGNSRLESLKETISRTVYYIESERFIGRQRLCVRATGDAGALVVAIRNVVHSLDPNLPVFDIKTFADHINATISRERLIALLSSFFGLFALLLAALGLYGVMSHAVARRTREIGIRMALGAQAPNVLWLVLRETLLLVSVGVAIGLPAALAAARMIKSWLFGLSANDPLTIALALLAMLATAALAGYLPALRAAQVDPMIALRHE